jgi:hypothetical protein
MGGSGRFCGRCGHELRLGARFCGTCGRSIPDDVGQRGAADSAHDPRAEPASIPVITAQPPPPAPATAAVTGSEQREIASPDAANIVIGDRGRPPPLASTWPAPDSGSSQMPSSQTHRWHFALGLVVLLAVGGVVAALLLPGHSKGHRIASSAHRNPTVPSTAANGSSPASVTTTPPTDLNIQGLTIGISAVNTDPDVTGVAATIAAYFAGIDSKNYRKAWNIYTPTEQAAIPFQQWSSELSTTQDGQITIQTIRHSVTGNIRAIVLFQSHQAPQYGPNQGETCTNWSLNYHLVPSSVVQSSPSASGQPSYLINKVTSVGAGNEPC